MTEEKKYEPFKEVYVYDKDTGAFLDSYMAQLSPMEAGVYITPVCSTDVIPPAPTAEHQIPVFGAGAWSLQPDFRGLTIHNQTDKSTMVVDAIGPLPVNYKLTPPPPTTEELLKSLEADVDVYIQMKASEKGYGSVDSMSKYITVTDEQIATLPVDQRATVTMYRDQCKSFVLWVAAVWAFCYNSKNSVSMYTQPLPTKEQLLAALPTAPW